MSKSYERLWAPITPPPAETCDLMPRPIPGFNNCLGLVVQSLLEKDFGGFSKSDDDMHLIGVLNVSMRGSDYVEETGVLVEQLSCQVDGCSMSCVLAINSSLSDAERPYSIGDPSVLDDCSKCE